MSALGLSCRSAASGAATTSPRCLAAQQRQCAAPSRANWALLSQQRRFAVGRQLGLAAQRLTAPKTCSRPAAAADIAMSGGEAGSGSGVGGSSNSGTVLSPLLSPLLQGVWDWLCRVKPPRTLWRTIAALVLGGEAVVRILQGKGWEDWNGKTLSNRHKQAGCPGPGSDRLAWLFPPVIFFLHRSSLCDLALTQARSTGKTPLSS